MIRILEDLDSQSLNEMINTNILFRTVDISFLKEIITSNTMKATCNSLQGNCVCFTRNKHYTKTHRPFGITFSFNRDKLSNNYRIVPYMNKGEDKLKFNEFEERIYKDISDLKNYIIDIDISKLNRNDELTKLKLQDAGFQDIINIKKFLLTNGYDENQIII